jgi:thiol-disulfide isomerase/thioredoxin
MYAIIAYLVINMLSHPQPHEFKHNLTTSISSMVSTVKAMISNTNTDTKSGIQKASDVKTITGKVSTPPSNVDAVDAKEATTTPKAYQTMEDGEKRELEKATKDYLNEHEVVVVMFFAEWCGHCAKAMHPLMEAAAKQPKVPFLLINADTVPRSFLSSKHGGIADVEYFPMIVRFENGSVVNIFESEMTPENINSTVAAEPESANKDTNEALQMLF